MSIPDPKNKQNEYTFPVDWVVFVMFYFILYSNDNDDNNN